MASVLTMRTLRQSGGVAVAVLLVVALAGQRSALYHLLSVEVAHVADVVRDVADGRIGQVLHLALAPLRHFGQCRLAVLAEKAVTYNHYFFCIKSVSCTIMLANCSAC